MLTIEQIKTAAKITASEYPITKMQLFGSYADGCSTDNSDVDILVEFNPDAIVTLLTLCKIKNRMEDLLHTSVDIISMPIPKDSILEINKVVSLYAA